jgi:hypothetical protein
VYSARIRVAVGRGASDGNTPIFACAVSNETSELGDTIAGLDVDRPAATVRALVTVPLVF